ncbi:hypothetical protein OCC_10519 [Thermococcus litoralis DSM 5473]|uniref:Protein-glutamine gamma-glutamyltransferase-like C-terminal domain-containing protein n=1 Tax=Thermococcus litoralis (strain ATCC 51850 / DSM 5473 / JCM 8560 / NS-C) TaxID=523849 RepID=H3ZR62_THELN|nr:DUF4129 domain-containing protein [Thermococcus litoralis]EHR77531.1 hypothetical protein OCC_10519 [Thermococcus litoralis DSM 5473]
MRRRLMALYLLIILLMGAIVSSEAKIGEIKKGNQDYYLIGLFFAILIVLGGIILIQIFLTVGDPFAKKGPEYGVNWGIFLAIIIGSIILALPILYKVYKTPLPNMTANRSEGIYYVNQSYHVSFYERYFQNPFGGSSEGSVYLYVLFGVLVITLSYVAVRFYLDLRAARERRKLKEIVEQFDKKLEEEGIDFLGDPNEIVVKLYKNAVIWLRLLGIPYRESWTHWEHAEKVKYKHDAYVKLARLFEKAKYAPEKVTMEDAREAYELYMKIKGDVNEVEA